MSFSNIQTPDFPGYTDYPFLNKSGADIAADTPVTLDTTISDALSSDTGIKIKANVTGGNPSLCVGVAIDTIPNGGTGRVRCFGPISNVKCDGAVTVGTTVDASASVAGRVAAHTAGKAQLGLALVTGADGETIPIMLGFALNA